MIPLRLMLENFMCYREKTEIIFRGSTIWALSGHNGAGKSTIFDAMRYALYGEHRAGRQKIEALIHRGTTVASSFLIEFEFAVGEDEYRVQRTYSQKKKGTLQALHLVGPNAPVLGRPGPQFIPGTETKDGFDDWVLKVIGLDERAFTVSVLLLQGQSDKLLKLGSPEKHDVLAHIIDLSRYETLAKGALEKQKLQETLVKTYKRQLDDLSEIDEAALATIGQQVIEVQAKKEQARQHQLTLATLKEQTRRWQQVRREERRLHEELTRFEHLLAQAEQIERDFAQFAILRRVIQPLTLIQQKQDESNHIQQSIEQNQVQVTAIKVALQKVLQEIQDARQQLETDHTLLQQQEQEFKALHTQLLKLQIPCNDIDRLREKQQSYQELLATLSTFASDMEQQQLYLSERLDEICSIEKATPLLEHFADFRAEWQQATQHIARISQKLSDQKIVQEHTSAHLQELQKTRETIREQVSQLQSEVASHRALFAECQTRFERFHSIEGGATCSYCGQQLTPEHMEAERQVIQEELQKREDSLLLCTTSYNATSKQQKTIDRAIDQTAQKERQESQACEQLVQQQNTYVKKRDNAYIEAKNQLEQLAPEYLVRIQGTSYASIDVHTCLQTTYPTSQDVHVLTLRLQEKSALIQKLHELQKAFAQQQELHRTQRYMYSEIESLLQLYPPEHVDVLLKEREQAQQREEELSQSIKKLSIDIQQQMQHIPHLTEKERTLREELHRLEQVIGIAQSDVRTAKRTIAEIQEQLPPEWQKHVSHLSSEMLARWRQEIGELQSAAEKYQALTEARQDQGQLQQMLVALENEQRQFPAEARRMPEQVQEEIELTNASYKNFEIQEQRSRAELQRLQEIRKRYEELHQQWTEAMRLASRYRELAHLLGREGLQHYLLQNAEIGIVYHANDTLDRISGGTLRLELRSGSENKTKTLDMVAYNSSISAYEPQSIEQLSGSQQFRVAISLAIGIGRYMGNASHRVESIMIDEGFGGLDASSRDEMTQALQSLEDEFKCVIVVSHQNEFSDKFPNRYEVTLVNGQTTITLV